MFSSVRSLRSWSRSPRRFERGEVNLLIWKTGTQEELARAEVAEAYPLYVPDFLSSMFCPACFGRSCETFVLNLAAVVALGSRIGLARDEQKALFEGIIRISYGIPPIYVNCMAVNGTTAEIPSFPSNHSRKEIKELMLGSGLTEAETASIFTGLGFLYPSCELPESARGGGR